MSKWWIHLSITVTILQAIGMGIVPFVLYDWYLMTPDAGGWACGAQTLANTGQFSDGHTANLGYNFNICWTKDLYPGLQYFLAAIIHITELSAVHLIPVLLMVTLVATAVVLWLVGYRMSGSLFVLSVIFPEIFPVSAKPVWRSSAKKNVKQMYSCDFIKWILKFSQRSSCALS